MIARQHEAEARELAIPLDLYLSIPGEVRYQLRKFPEPIAHYWELDDFLKDLIVRQGLQRDSFREFVYDTSRETQSDRELLVAWFFAKFVGGLQEETMHFALALPVEDRGIDCYIRVVDAHSGQLGALPIQVCDIPIDGQMVDESNVENLILAACAKAKGKPTDCNDAILLLHILGRGEKKTVAFDRFRARDHFEKLEWSFRKIVLQTGTEETSEFCSLYCDDPAEHFRGVRANGKSRIIIGRTLAEELETGQRAETPGRFPLRI